MSIKKNLVMECECCGLTKPVKMFNLYSSVDFDCISCIEEQTEINDKLLKKIEEAGIDVLVSIYGNEFKKRITNMKCSSIPLQKRKDLITSKILEEVLKSNDEKLSKKLLDKYFAPKQKQVKDVEWVKEFEVGEEVLVYRGLGMGGRRKAKIIKINDKSITIRYFDYCMINDLHAIQLQTYGTHRLIWGSLGEEKRVIKSRCDIYKKGQESYYDPEFEEGKQSCDYGW